MPSDEKALRLFGNLAYRETFRRHRVVIINTCCAVWCGGDQVEFRGSDPSRRVHCLNLHQLKTTLVIEAIKQYKKVSVDRKTSARCQEYYVV